MGGVKIEALDGPSAGASTLTNAHGTYFFAEAFEPSVTFRASKDGFVAATGKASYGLASQGSLWFQLSAAAEPIAIDGEFNLTFVADSACTDVPSELRTRTYQVTISPSHLPNHPPRTVFRAELTGGSLLPGYSDFTIGLAGVFAGFSFDAGHHPEVVEVTAPNTYLALEGWAGAPFQASASTVFSAVFRGAIEYCKLKSGMSGEYWCSPAETEAKSRCESLNHRVTLTRR